MATDASFLSRIVVENYKSIALCDVRLGPLTFVVGRNGAGKTNFLDALGFMADALRSSLDHAVHEHGDIFRWVGATFGSLRIGVEFRLPDDRLGSYSFQIGARQLGQEYSLCQEECRVWWPGAEANAHYFQVIDGRVTASNTLMPAVLRNHLYLVNASGMADFTTVYERLAAIQYYTIDATHMRRSLSTGEERILAPDGRNITSVLLWLANHQPAIKARVIEYLQAILPNIDDVIVFEFGSGYYLTFKQSVGANQLDLGAESMSDGTLRALGVLVALLQQPPGAERGLSLIAIEEPETHLHPAASAVLRDALFDGSELAQVIVTTQSADLLDSKDIPPESILAVLHEKGMTRIGSLGEGQQSSIRDHLATAGEMLRSSNVLPTTTLSAIGERT